MDKLVVRIVNTISTVPASGFVYKFLIYTFKKNDYETRDAPILNI